jgi:hypothetical protein
MDQIFDVLLSDVDKNVLDEGISAALGVKYLSSAPDDKFRSIVDGHIFGRNRRVVMPFIISNKKDPFFAHFIFDTGSAQTFVSLEVCGVHNKALHY